MENPKVFHSRDAFFIAEAIDSLTTTVLIPHEEKEFHDKDAYVIWTKIQAIIMPPTPPVNSTDLLFFRVPLAALQIQNLNSIPVLAIPAPGVGKAIDLISASMVLVFGTVAFTNNYMQILCSSVSGGPASQLDTGFGVLSQPATVFVKLIPNISGGIAIQYVDNDSMVLKAEADSAVGDGSAVVCGCSRILDL